LASKAAVQQGAAAIAVTGLGANGGEHGRKLEARPGCNGVVGEMRQERSDSARA
jgi:hypothetical protein